MVIIGHLKARGGWQKVEAHQDGFGSPSAEYKSQFQLAQKAQLEKVVLDAVTLLLYWSMAKATLTCKCDPV